MRTAALTILSLATLLAGCAVETADDESEADSAQLLAGRRLPESEVARLLRGAGFPESVVPEMVCTARHESALYEEATNRNRNGSIDRGLFQVNSVHVGGTPGCPSNGAALFDATVNTRCAYAIYRMQGLNAWYGYRRHRAECDRYTIGRTDVGDGDGDGGGEDDGADGGGDADSCRSATLGRTVAPGTCVQSKSDRQWYRCSDGRWRRSSMSSSEPSGACAASYPL